MNERIKELAEQATIFVADYDGQRWQIDSEKFAELIVKECANTAKHNVMNISTYADAKFVEEQIQKHFGVEE